MKYTEVKIINKEGVVVLKHKSKRNSSDSLKRKRKVQKTWIGKKYI